MNSDSSTVCQFLLENGYTKIEWGGANLPLGHILWPIICCACGRAPEGESINTWSTKTFQLSSSDFQFTIMSSELSAYLCPDSESTGHPLNDFFHARLQYKKGVHILVLHIGNPRVADKWRILLQNPLQVVSDEVKEKYGVDISFDALKSAFGIISDKRYEPGKPGWRPLRAKRYLTLLVIVIGLLGVALAGTIILLYVLLK